MPLSSTFGFTDDVGMQGEHILGSYLESAIEEKDLFPAPYMYVPFYLQLYKDYKPGDGPLKVSTADQAALLLKSKRLPAKRALGMMSKIRDEMSGQVLLDGTIEKRMTAADQAKLEEAKALHRKLLVAAGVRAETIFDGPVEAGHPCCTAGIGRVVDEHQQTEIAGLYVADASVFPSPLGMPPILTIVAMSKRLSRHLLGRRRSRGLGLCWQHGPGRGSSDHHDAEEPVDREQVTRVDVASGVRHPCDAGQAILPGDDGPVDEHPPAPLHDGGGEGGHEGHAGFEAVADQDLPALKGVEVLGPQSHPGLPHRNPGTGGLTHQLPGLEKSCA